MFSPRKVFGGSPALRIPTPKKAQRDVELSGENTIYTSPCNTPRKLFGGSPALRIPTPKLGEDRSVPSSPCEKTTRLQEPFTVDPEDDMVDDDLLKVLASTTDSLVSMERLKEIDNKDASFWAEQAKILAKTGEHEEVLNVFEVAMLKGAKPASVLHSALKEFLKEKRSSKSTSTSSNHALAAELLSPMDIEFEPALVEGENEKEKQWQTASGGAVRKTPQKVLERKTGRREAKYLEGAQQTNSGRVLCLARLKSGEKIKRELGSSYIITPVRRSSRLMKIDQENNNELNSEKSSNVLLVDSFGRRLPFEHPSEILMTSDHAYTPNKSVSLDTVENQPHHKGDVSSQWNLARLEIKFQSEARRKRSKVPE